MTDHLREIIISSEKIFTGRLLTVRIDCVRLFDGHDGRREVVEHPGAVAMVPMLDADHLLLVRQWRNAAGRSLLEIPAGTLSPGEEPDHCAARELMEEVGFRPQKLTLLYGAFLAPGYSTELIHLYLAEDLVPETRLHDPDERIEVVSCTWNDIDNLRKHGELGDMKTLAGLLLAQQHLNSR